MSFLLDTNVLSELRKIRLGLTVATRNKADFISAGVAYVRTAHAGTTFMGTPDVSQQVACAPIPYPPA